MIRAQDGSELLRTSPQLWVSISRELRKKESLGFLKSNTKCKTREDPWGHQPSARQAGSPIRVPSWLLYLWVHATGQIPLFSRPAQQGRDLCAFLLLPELSPGELMLTSSKAMFPWPALLPRPCSHDLHHSSVIKVFSCSQVSPCHGWMSSNKTLRNLTSEVGLSWILWSHLCLFSTCVCCRIFTGGGVLAGQWPPSWWIKKKKNSNSWMLEEPRECGVPCLPTLLHWACHLARVLSPCLCVCLSCMHIMHVGTLTDVCESLS